MAARTRIIGIDPGARRTGYAVIDSDGHRSSRVTSGCIRLPEAPLPERLAIIFREVVALIEDHRPQAMAVEEVFVNRNVSSALKLGHARAAAICAGAHAGLPIAEYSPARVKQGVVGTGRADKHQVSHMVVRLLGLHEISLQEDEADALAVALCHAHSALGLGAIAGGRRS